MGAVIKACLFKNRNKNTGIECHVSMGATAMLLAVVAGYTWTDADLEDADAWLAQAIHDKNIFPLFGINAPINTITNNTEADLELVLDDGQKVFLRYGMYNRELATTMGGLCFAEALMSFLNTGHGIVELDQSGQMLQRKNEDGSYGGLKTPYTKGLSPILADLKTTVYMNRFGYSYSPLEMVYNGTIFAGAQSLLDAMGLLDVIIYPTPDMPGTTTKLYVSIKTHCAEADVVAKLGTKLNFVNNFVVTNKATKALVTITAVLVVGTHVELTGTFVVGQTYLITGSSASLWYTHQAIGYDPTYAVAEVTIP